MALLKGGEGEEFETALKTLEGLERRQQTVVVGLVAVFTAPHVDKAAEHAATQGTKAMLEAGHRGGLVVDGTLVEEELTTVGIPPGA